MCVLVVIGALIADLLVCGVVVPDRELSSGELNTSVAVGDVASVLSSSR